MRRGVPRRSDTSKGQETLFGDARYPERVSFVMLADGKPVRVRKEFLDCTVDEARALIASRAPARRESRRRDVDTSDVEALVARVGPSLMAGQTFREALEKVANK